MTVAEAEKEAASGKVPMPASGQDSPKLHSDGVSDAGTHGQSGGSKSAGGAYPNPYTGKEARGESGSFDGGQSEQGYTGAASWTVKRHRTKRQLRLTRVAAQAADVRRRLKAGARQQSFGQLNVDTLYGRNPVN